MKKFSRILSGFVASFFVFTLLGGTVAAQVQVTEFMANPDLIILGDVEGEWVELQNTDTVPVDLTGWELSINGTSHTFAGAGLVVNPGEFFIVCRHPNTPVFIPFVSGANENGNVPCNYIWATMPMLTNTSGSLLEVKDPADNVTDTVTYNDDGNGEDVQSGESTQVVQDENGNDNYYSDTDNTYYNPTFFGIPLGAENTGTPGSVNPTAPPAATVTEVNPNNLNGWVHSTEAVGSNGTYELQKDATSPPRGTGSLQLVTPNPTDHSAFMTAAFNGTRLADIVSLSYSTYRHSGDPAPAIALQLNFDEDLTDADETWKGRLVYEPYHTQTVDTGVWQNWNTLTNSGTGNWWFSNGTMAGLSGCAQATPCTYQEVLDAFPEAGIHQTLGATIFKAGSGWTNFTGNVDSFNIATAGNSASPYNVIVDFENDKIAPVVTVNDLATSTPSPEITGTVSELNLAGTVVTVNIDGADYVATVNPDGTWFVPAGDISNLSAGTYTATATAVDPDGNISTPVSGTVVIKSVVPAITTGNTPIVLAGTQNTNANLFAINETPAEEPQVEADTDDPQTSSTQTTEDEQSGDQAADDNKLSWWWLLLLAAIAGLAWWIMLVRRRADEE